MIYLLFSGTVIWFKLKQFPVFLGTSGMLSFVAQNSVFIPIPKVHNKIELFHIAIFRFLSNSHIYGN